MQSKTYMFIHYSLPVYKTALDKIKISSLNVSNYRVIEIISMILESRNVDNIKILKYYLDKIQKNNIKITDKSFLNFLSKVIAKVIEEDVSEEELDL